MKRILFITLAVLLSTLSASAYKFKVDGIAYNYYKKEAYVVKGGDYTGSITIPKTVTYNGVTYTVTEIGNYAFNNCTDLISVTLPNSVVQIGYAAFESCTALTSISIPNSVTSIGSRTFRSCTNLTNVTIPNSVTYIGDEAFNGTP